MQKNLLHFVVLATACIASNLANADLQDEWTTNEVVINFEVEVKESACEVFVGQPMSKTPIIEMGSFSTSPGSKGPLKPLFFQFKNCKGVSQIDSIAYTRDVGIASNPGSEEGNPTNGFISTNKAKVRIYLYSDANGTQKFEKKTFTAQHIAPNEMIPVCFAQAQVWDTTAAQAGQFSGKAEFTITYH